MLQKKLGNKLFVLEVIRDLDEAIDMICEAMSPNEKLDPFAEDLCPYFGELWPAGEGLARFLSDHPYLVRGKSILELGCGIGLPSMVASHLEGKVLATDFHPDVEEFFQRNCRHSVIQCDYQRMNWREENNEVGLFDVVMGSDVLYESKHPLDVAKGLVRYLKKDGIILLADPGRAYLGKFLDAALEIGLTSEKQTLEVDGKAVLLYVLSKIV
jgi:predicted nicotinamide N-methyase